MECRDLAGAPVNDIVLLLNINEAKTICEGDASNDDRS